MSFAVRASSKPRSTMSRTSKSRDQRSSRPASRSAPSTTGNSAT